MQPLPRGELCLEGRWAGRSDASWGECRPLTCVILHAVWTDSLHVNYSKCVVDSFGCKLLLEKTVAYLSPGRLFPVVDVAVVLSSVVVCCALFVWWCVDIIWWLHHLVIREDASCQIFCPLLISHKVLPDIVFWGGNGGCGHVLGQRGDGSCCLRRQGPAAAWLPEVMQRGPFKPGQPLLLSEIISEAPPSVSTALVS